MAVPIQMATMSANHLAVEQLAQNNQLTEAQKIGEVARHFEAILLRQLSGFWHTAPHTPFSSPH